MRHLHTTTLALMATTLLITSCTGQARTAPALTAEERIHWYEWEPDTFARAQAEDKPILLDLTAVWCHWCHVMDQTSYSDPQVIELINSLFIPIRVNTDKRPDVQSRYLMGGWPTTAFLTPEGDIIAGGTYFPPESLIPLLQEMDVLYRTDKDAIALRITQARQVIIAAGPEPADGIPTDSTESALYWIASVYDPLFGGFSQETKYHVPGAVTLIFRYNYPAGDDVLQGWAFHTLNGMQSLEDPVWGGLYRYSVTPDWQMPHFEKVLPDNAKALREYLEAYQITGYSAYRSTATGIMGYVERFLWDPDGGFYGSQDADLYTDADHQILMTGEEYYRLSEEERLAVGIPSVDRTLFTGWNGQMILAALEAATVLNEPHYRDMALQALDRLWAQGRGPQGQMWHSLQADASGNLTGQAPFTLDDQVDFGLVLVTAYSVTGRREYLVHAEELADYILSEMHNRESGGLYDLAADPDAAGVLDIRATVCDSNVAAARLFTRLYWMTTEDRYRRAAEGALLLCGGEMAETPSYALAADEYLIHPLTLVVVGSPGEESAGALLTAANRFYVPGKVVMLLDPSLGPPALGDFAYPADQVAVYACRGRVCSVPITDPGDLPERINDLMAVGE